MELPPPVRLAHHLAGALRGLDWGIGGSSLLWKLGLAAEPRDLDLVTTAAHFVEVRRRISSALGEGSSVSHPTYQSRCFTRFASSGPVPVDLFADVTVRTPGGTAEWTFDPADLDVQNGLPWMLPRDWVRLYQLFDRPAKARALEDYIAGLRDTTGASP